MIFTAVEGSAMAASGALALALKLDSVSLDLKDSLLNDVHVLPLLFAVPILIGLAIQYSALAKKKAKKKRASGGDG